MTSSSGRDRARQWRRRAKRCPNAQGARASAKSRGEEALSIQLTQSPRRPHGNGKLRAEITTRMDSVVSTARISCGACDVRDIDYKGNPYGGREGAGLTRMPAEE